MSIIEGLAILALLAFLAWLGAAAWRARTNPRTSTPSAGLVPDAPSVTIDPGGPAF